MLRKILLAIIKKMKFLPADIFMKAYYEYYVGKKLDLKNPVEFNQKIQWLKVFYRPMILSQLVDKFEVREYVGQKVGDQYLNQLIGVYNSPREINFDQLPDKFVLKATHGYHFNLLVKNKKNLNKRNGYQKTNIGEVVWNGHISIQSQGLSLRNTLKKSVKRILTITSFFVLMDNQNCFMWTLIVALTICAPIMTWTGKNCP